MTKITQTPAPTIEGRPDATTPVLACLTVQDQLCLVRDRAVAIALLKANETMQPVVYADLRAEIPTAKRGGLTAHDIRKSLARLIGRRLIRPVRHTNRVGNESEAFDVTEVALHRFANGLRFSEGE